MSDYDRMVEQLTNGLQEALAPLVGSPQLQYFAADCAVAIEYALKAFDRPSNVEVRNETKPEDLARGYLSFGFFKRDTGERLNSGADIVEAMGWGITP